MSRLLKSPLALGLAILTLMLFGLNNVQAEEDSAPKAWLTFAHGQAENGHNVSIRSDQVFSVDNHFMIVDPPRLVVDIAEAQIHKNIYLAVNQPELTMIRAANRENRVRLVLDLPPESLQKYELVAQKNRVTITLLARVKKQAPIAPLGDGKVSITLHKAELADFFAIISKASGRTIQVDESIKTRISLRLVDMNWEDALAQVLKLYKLDIKEQDDIWYAYQPKK